MTTIVVDDASEPPLAGATLRLDTNRGPAAARNAGLAHVTTPFVAFVDTDVDVDEFALLALCAHLRDERVALVAPRVVGAGTSVLERYETVRSPLDVGREPARVAAGSRVSYVPGAVLVCRTDAVRDVGGFDESLRYGEDVDLAWRLAARGRRCRFDPSVVVTHATRTSLRSWIAQRIGYGTSAAPLSRRHRGALAPVRMNGWSAATWAAVTAGAVQIGAVLGIGSTLALVRKLPDVPAAESLRLAGLGHLHAGRLVAGAALRVWWPLALLSRRGRTMLLVAAALTVLDVRRDPPDLPLPAYAALRVLDDVAYGAGVWLGAIREGTAAPLVPAVTPWPPR